MDRTDTTLVLPDSRLKADRKVVRGWHPVAKDYILWQQIFCANCGVEYGWVPEQSTDFVCWLCDPCANEWGPQYGLAFMPEEVFWQNVQAEMVEKYGRILTDAEVAAEAQYDCNPLGKLLRGKV